MRKHAGGSIWVENRMLTHGGSVAARYRLGKLTDMTTACAKCRHGRLDKLLHGSQKVIMCRSTKCAQEEISYDRYSPNALGAKGSEGDRVL